MHVGACFKDIIVDGKFLDGCEIIVTLASGFQATQKHNTM